MKEFGNTLAQLFFIIMVMIMLAVSTATLSEWATPDTSVGSSSSSSIGETADGGRVGQSETAAPSLSAATH